MSNPLYQKDVIAVTDFSRAELELILKTAQYLKATPQHNLLKNKVIASCFFEPSTRTRLSFETAIHRLGGAVVGFDSASNTSHANKGETFTDSIKIITSYVDALVMRHPIDGAAQLASECALATPIINAGDGGNQHPSQTILDLYSIYETQGSIDNISIAMVGDLKYGRTVHSLTEALAKFSGVHFYFVSPPALAMPEHIYCELDAAGIKYSLHSNIDEIVDKLDILYMTRVQKERLAASEYEHIKSACVLTAKTLAHARSNLKVLHPLPRIDEITVDVDATPYAYYFQQAKNGIYAREALLALVLNKEIPDLDIMQNISVSLPTKTKVSLNKKCSNSNCISNAENIAAKFNQTSINGKEYISCHYCNKII